MEESVESAQYIEDYTKATAIELGIDISEKSFESILAKSRNLTKPQVNRKLISLSRKKVSNNKISNNDAEYLDSIPNYTKENAINSEKESAKLALRDARSLEARQIEYISIAVKAYEKIHAMEQTPVEKYSKIVSDITSNSFYKFHSIYNKKIIFTTSEVILKHKNLSAKLNYEVNIGSFSVIIDIETKEVRVAPFNNNLMVNNRIFHPHVSFSSGICWGNARSAYDKFITECDPRPLMGALEALLKIYNDESPYADIGNFVELSSQRRSGLMGLTLQKNLFISVHNIYANLEKINYALLPKLKYLPIFHCQSSNTLFFTGVNYGGTSYIELNDGSFLPFNSFILQERQATNSLTVNGNYEDVISALHSSGYGNKIAKESSFLMEFDYSKFMKLNTDNKKKAVNILRIPKGEASIITLKEILYGK